ncbi:MAG: hypothetical protein GW905_12650 [Rhodobacterales bacterium]|nr:hypothetical protein [Rhodobacterales bacterium]
MADTEKTAAAERKTIPQKIAEPIIGAKLVTLNAGGSSTPALIYRGPIPKIGTKLLATLDNGVTYAGIVADATDADGEVLVEFRHGLTPQIEDKPEPQPVLVARREPKPAPQQPDTTPITINIIPD